MEPQKKTFGLKAETFQLKSLFESETKTLNIQPFICEKCNFVVYNGKCFSCNTVSQNFKEYESKNMHFTKQIDTTKEKTLYVFCLDNSGSVQVTYTLQDDYKQVYDFKGLKERMSEDDFVKLKVLGDQRIYQNINSIKEYLDAKVNVEDIIEELGTKTMTKTISNQPTRKQIMKEVMSSILKELKEKDNCDVVVTFFNERITGQGIEDTQLMFMNGEEKIAFAAGADAAKSIKIYQKKQYDSTQQLFKKYQEEGGTALGPAIVYCCGIAAGLKYDRTQIVLITDGTSNTGFGEVESVKKTQNNPHAYEVSEIYSNIAAKYMIPNNIMLNMMIFSDSEVKIYILEKFITMTGGNPVMLKVQEKKKNKVSDIYLSTKTYNDTKNKFKHQVIDLSSNSLQKLRIAFVCSNSNIRMKNQLYGASGFNSISFSCGNLSLKSKIQLKLESIVPLQELQDIQITIILQTRLKSEEVQIISHKTVSMKPKPKMLQQSKNAASSVQMIDATEKSKKFQSNSGSQASVIGGESNSMSYKSDQKSVSFMSNHFYDDDSD